MPTLFFIPFYISFHKILYGYLHILHPYFFPKLIRFSSEISFFNILSHCASIAKFSDKYADVPVLWALPVIIVIFIPASSFFRATYLFFLSILGIEDHCKNVFIPYWMLKYVDSCTLSHINSVSREPLGNKMPYEALPFFYGEEMLKKPHEIKIEKDDVTLMLHLLKSQNTAK